jgi:hypothetical protein
MLCENVIPLLSEFLDEALDADKAVQVSQHLGQCIRCRKEFNSLSDMQRRLRSLERVEAPEYLRRRVHLQLAREPWRARVRNELERYWSIIRTTEAMWYATRALGTVVASIFFLLVPSTITPYLAVEAQDAQRASITPAYYCLGQQPAYRNNVSRSLSQKLGMAPAQIKSQPGRSAPAALNDLYLLEYGQSIPRAGEDDSFAVVTTVDRSGAAKVETVLEHPADQTLLSSFIGMIASARFRPASSNGQAVTSPLVFTFSKVFVSE